jgi:hypothetical protein
MTTEPVVPSSKTLESNLRICVFPVELLDVIVKELGISLVEEIRNLGEDHSNCRVVLGQFRNVILTCKYFHWLMCKWRADSVSSIPIAYRAIGMTFADVLNQLAKFQSTRLASISISVVRKTYGNVHLNPRFPFSSLLFLLRITKPYRPKSLLILGGYFDIQKQPISQRHEQLGRYFYRYVPGRVVPPFLTEEPTSAVTRNEDCVLRSFRDWTYVKDPRVTGKSVAPEVTEWWVWHTAQNWRSPFLYFSGYSQGQAWVVNARKLIVYTNFEEPRSLLEEISIE